ncbi:ABC transporter ATP-binding protein [Acutalibacter muris]|uniref:ABC transporter ATP-binding protein n=1 Tax=Acutalibacter muris TaxID=1796620 RepID=A0A1Z2XRA4_9FIRM|nr:ABC transporter ATP-binding protein [Acutalibacter muris]ANU55776.1 ABC transporter ATP-binding protein [Hungateiclostridiaceae bacterium KB18]ASB40982.1 ABC transporter ATP-binding protein [Acutalibacter muris]QQR30264.1 ABC transporter ATP-binding protein [Acutalibacter muris]
MEMLTLSHIAKRFGEKQVLRDVSFSVPEHTVFGFVGQNGAGKTTAMKLILGLLTSDSGEITVNGMRVHYGNTQTNRFVGYLPDVPEFYSYMTPTEYLRFCGEITGMPSKEIKGRCEELLRLVGLEKEDRRIKGFSRGMKQRLGIAQALFGRPKLLICDEPTSALDPAGRKELLDILVNAKEQTTVLFSTHILSDVEHICDEIAFLHDGRIVLQGSLEEVRKIKTTAAAELELERLEDSQTLSSVFPHLKSIGRNTLLLEDAGNLPDILYYLGDKRIPVLRIERQEASLEELFMEVVGK